MGVGPGRAVTGRRNVGVDAAAGPPAHSGGDDHSNVVRVALSVDRSPHTNSDNILHWSPRITSVLFSPYTGSSHVGSSLSFVQGPCLVPGVTEARECLRPPVCVDHATACWGDSVRVWILRRAWSMRCPRDFLGQQEACSAVAPVTEQLPLCWRWPWLWSRQSPAS